MTIQVTLSQAQINDLQTLLDGGSYPEAYLYVRDALESTGTADPRLVTWFEKAASINANDGSFASNFAHNSAQSAVALAGGELTDYQFQEASNTLADRVISQIINEGGVHDVDTIVVTDVAAAKNFVDLSGSTLETGLVALFDSIQSHLDSGSDFYDDPNSISIDDTSTLAQVADSIGVTVEDLLSTAGNEYWQDRFLDGENGSGYYVAKDGDKIYYAPEDNDGSYFMQSGGDWYNASDFEGNGPMSQVTRNIRDALGDYSQAMQPLTDRRGDPLVFDLDGDGIELVHIDDVDVEFQLDNDGLLEDTGWVAPDDALLVMDRNGDGIINDINELFGSELRTGFEELADLDSNGDGVMNAADEQFDQLMLWRDLNQDGVSQAEEPESIISYGIESIGLTPELTNQEIEGNLLIETAMYTTLFGTSGTVGEVLFRLDTGEVLGQNADGSIDFDPMVFLLPHSRGYGDLFTLQVAMNQDAQLLNMVADLNNMSLENWGDFRGNVEDILYRWSLVDEVQDGSRGEFFDARKLEFMEAFFAQDYLSLEGGNMPDNEQSIILDNVWQNIINTFVERFAVQGPLKHLFAEASYDFATDQLAWR